MPTRAENRRNHTRQFKRFPLEVPCITSALISLATAGHMAMHFLRQGKGDPPKCPAAEEEKWPLGNEKGSSQSYRAQAREKEAALRQ